MPNVCSLQVIEAGRVPYEEGLDLQKRLADEVRGDPSRAYLILLEHPSVFTLGKNGSPSNVLDAHGIPVVRTDRGGDVTYHGPGQLVGYPILNLRAMRLGVRTLVERLERVLVGALRDLGVEASRKEGCVGVWRGAAKIASLGLRIDRGVSRHGFALNVSNDLAPFGWIHPCGIPACSVTSVERVVGRPCGTGEAGRAVAGRFAAAFGFPRAVVSGS